MSRQILALIISTGMYVYMYACMYSMPVLKLNQVTYGSHPSLTWITIQVSVGIEESNGYHTVIVSNNLHCPLIYSNNTVSCIYCAMIEHPGKFDRL